jgi:hypothetical protein
MQPSAVIQGKNHMNTYNSSNLNTKTPKDKQDGLVAALKGVHGVKNATLSLGSSEFVITPLPNTEPKRDAISAAAGKAGFPVTRTMAKSSKATKK